jgi:hypothetical protein
MTHMLELHQVGDSEDFFSTFFGGTVHDLLACLRYSIRYVVFLLASFYSSVSVSGRSWIFLYRPFSLMFLFDCLSPLALCGLVIL